MPKQPKIQNLNNIRFMLAVCTYEAGRLGLGKDWTATAIKPKTKTIRRATLYRRAMDMLERAQRNNPTKAIEVYLVTTTELNFNPSGEFSEHEVLFKLHSEFSGAGFKILL